MSEKPAHPVYATEATRAAYGPLLEQLPQMAGFGANAPALVIMTPADLRAHLKGQGMPDADMAQKIRPEQMWQQYGDGMKAAFGQTGAPPDLYSYRVLNDTLFRLATDTPGATNSPPGQTGGVCVLLLPEKPVEFMQTYPDYKWQKDVTHPVAQQILQAPDPGFVPVHETAHCIQNDNRPLALDEREADQKAGQHFPEVGAVNSRVRIIGSVLDAAFRFVDGHETGYVENSPDPRAAAADSIRVHMRLAGIVAADVGMKENAAPDKMLEAVQKIMKSNDPRGADLEGMKKMEAMLEAGMDVKSLKETLAGLSPALAGAVRENYGLAVAKDVLKDDPKKFAEALYDLQRHGGVANAGPYSAISQSVERLSALYLNSVADMYPEASHLRVPLPVGVEMQPLPERLPEPGAAPPPARPAAQAGQMP